MPRGPSPATRAWRKTPSRALAAGLSPGCAAPKGEEEWRVRRESPLDHRSSPRPRAEARERGPTLRRGLRLEVQTEARNLEERLPDRPSRGPRNRGSAPRGSSRRRGSTEGVRDPRASRPTPTPWPTSLLPRPRASPRPAPRGPPIRERSPVPPDRACLPDVPLTSRRPSGLRKTRRESNSLAHRTTWLRSDLPLISDLCSRGIDPSAFAEDRRSERAATYLLIEPACLTSL